MNRVCLVVLIGLPGAGKTTFCQYLMQMHSLPFNVLHLCYDDLISFNSDGVFHYKEQRDNILKFLKETVVKFKTNLPKELQTTNVYFRNCHQNDTIILFDDNHYYRSMRYKLFQLARDENLGYCQIYFNCTDQLALERNCLRNVSQKIPNDIILQMCCRLEAPNTLHYQWEKNTIIWQTSNSCGNNYHEMVSFITQVLNNRMQPSQATFSKSATTQSRVHELDLLLRKHITNFMRSNQKKAYWQKS